MVYLILSPLLSLALLSGMTVSLANKNGSDKERYVILMWLCFLLAPSLGGLAAFLPRATISISACLSASPSHRGLSAASPHP